ncbi:MAG: acetyltransferase, partial [Cytophagaceae bacterium]
MTEVLIFPYNGNGFEALSCLRPDQKFIGFVDDIKEKQGKTMYGFEVFSREALVKYPHARVLAMPGGPQSFLGKIDSISSLKVSEERFINIIHPSSKISPYAKIGKNVLIMANVVITANAVIEDHVCILPNSVIHHDTIIRAYSMIGAGVVVAGNTTIGANSYIGSGSNIINNIEIGERVLVGLGSNVLKSIPSDTRVAGNP